jgi:hypothetical protein
VAPSWSWISVKGQLNIKVSAPNTGANLRILGIDIEEDKPGTLGRVRHGKIDAEGLLQEVEIDRSIHPTPRRCPYQEYSIIEGVGGNATFISMLNEYKESDDAWYSRWCLQIGTYNVNGRDSLMFLLLEKATPFENHFRRVGVAEIDAWYNPAHNAYETYFFLFGQWLSFTLV